MNRQQSPNHTDAVADAHRDRPLLSGRGLSRRYAAHYALRNVDFDVWPGRVHALLGHNGAGKSTLISLLSGAQRPDEGEIVFDETVPERWSPATAIEHGIAVIYQHLSLVDSLSVSDNIFLGTELRKGIGVDHRAQESRAAEILAELGATCRPRDPVSSLPTAQRQLVEIAKALRRNARVLILDEPTAALSNRESSALARLIDSLKSRGIGIVYVTHLLAEVARLADEITVLEGGSVQFNGSVSELTHDDLVRLLARGAAKTGRLAERDLGEVVLASKSVEGNGFGSIDLEVREGEILVLFGMLGSGRNDFLRALAGTAPRHGEVEIRGTRLPAGSLQRAHRQGLFFVGPDRGRDGIFPQLSTFDNVLMSSFGPLSRFARIARSERNQWQTARSAVGLAEVPATPTGRLSGGNQQKTVVGRAIGGARRPSAILLDEPTQGVDVGARRDIYRAIENICVQQAVGVVVSTNDPEEAVTLADRVLIFSHGRVVAELSRAEINEERLLALASEIGSARAETRGEAGEAGEAHGDDDTSEQERKQ